MEEINAFFVTITDNTGRLFLQQRISESTIADVDLKELSKGLYTLTIVDHEGKTFRRRIMVE